VFVPEFVEELLESAGFSDIRHVAAGETSTEHSEIVALDNRPRESLFVEAIK
jgi:hypothetical protein